MPYKPTGKPSGRPKAPPLIVPAVPVITPEQGSLQETIMLGDAASVNANPATKLRWFATRAEIQQVIAKDEVTKAKAEVTTATTRAEELTAANAALTEQLKAQADSLASNESDHAVAIANLEYARDNAVARADSLAEQVDKLKPAADRWAASQSPTNADALGALAKQEVKDREIAAIKKELFSYDRDRELRPSGMWQQSILPKVAADEYLERERVLRRKLMLLTETADDKKKRLATEAAEKEKARKHLDDNPFKDNRKFGRDDPALREIRYTRDQVFKEPVPKKPVGLLTGHWPY